RGAKGAEGAQRSDCKTLRPLRVLCDSAVRVPSIPDTSLMLSTLEGETRNAHHPSRDEGGWSDPPTFVFRRTRDSDEQTNDPPDQLAGLNKPFRTCGGVEGCRALLHRAAKRLVQLPQRVPWN